MADFHCCKFTDLNYLEDSGGGPDVTIALLPKIDKITLLQVSFISTILVCPLCPGLLLFFFKTPPTLCIMSLKWNYLWCFYRSLNFVCDSEVS